MKNDTQDNLMVRYLLGDLPESEQAALEEWCFADGDSFDQMWENENRLVDGYVRGRLAPADRAQFESHYLASPVHRQRVETARSLLDAADESARAQAAPEIRPSFWQRLTAGPRLQPAWQWAMAAGMLLLAAGGIWLLAERMRLRSELASLQAENAARQTHEQELAGQVAAGRSERDRLSAELEQLRNRQIEPRPIQSPTPQSVLKIFSFVLSPLSVRGSAGQPITVALDADQVQLRLTLPPGEWKSLQASIRTAERQPVWSQQLKARAGKVTVTVPAGKLPFNDYTLTLSGTNRAGETEEINRYSFRVIRE